MTGHVIKETLIPSGNFINAIGKKKSAVIGTYRDLILWDKFPV